MQNKTTEIATIRQAVRPQEWSQLIEAQQASGLTIKQWGEENGIKPNLKSSSIQKEKQQKVITPNPIMEID